MNSIHGISQNFRPCAGHSTTLRALPVNLRPSSLAAQLLAIIEFIVFIERILLVETNSL
jgi:hypothetical protein